METFSVELLTVDVLTVEVLMVAVSVEIGRGTVREVTLVVLLSVVPTDVPVLRETPVVEVTLGVSLFGVVVTVGRLVETVCSEVGMGNFVTGTGVTSGNSTFCVTKGGPVVPIRGGMVKGLLVEVMRRDTVVAFVVERVVKVSFSLVVGDSILAGLVVTGDRVVASGCFEVLMVVLRTEAASEVAEVILDTGEVETVTLEMVTARGLAVVVISLVALVTLVVELG